MSDIQLSHTRPWRPPGGAAATAVPGFSRGSRGPATAGGRVSVSEDSDVAGPVCARSVADRKSKGLNVLFCCSAASSLPLCFASLSKSRGAGPYTSRVYSNPGGRTTGARRSHLGETGDACRVPGSAAGPGRTARAGRQGRSPTSAGRHGCPTAVEDTSGSRLAPGLVWPGPTLAAPTPAHRGCGPRA